MCAENGVCVCVKNGVRVCVCVRVKNNIAYSLLVCYERMQEHAVWACMCVCVCVCEQGRRSRGGWGSLSLPTFCS